MWCHSRITSSITMALPCWNFRYYKTHRVVFCCYSVLWFITEIHSQFHCCIMARNSFIQSKLVINHEIYAQKKSVSKCKSGLTTAFQANTNSHYNKLWLYLPKTKTLTKLNGIKVTIKTYFSMKIVGGGTKWVTKFPVTQFWITSTLVAITAA